MSILDMIYKKFLPLNSCHDFINKRHIAIKSNTSSKGILNNESRLENYMACRQRNTNDQNQPYTHTLLCISGFFLYFCIIDG
jgi:hypothetical protein